MIEISAFTWVPPFAQGLVRDLRVRWALAEAGISYEVRLLGPGENGAAEHRRLQPFGQVPTYRDGDLVLFESGAIVLHIAEGCPALMPADPGGRARVQAWMFAALNTLEPPVMELSQIDLFDAAETWAQLRRPGAVEAVQTRLTELAAWLGDREYLEQRFSAADLLMTTVLRTLRHTELVTRMPTLEAYRLRCEARPAFIKVLAEQMAGFAEHAPPAA